MINTAYTWTGFVVGVLAVLLSLGALVSELQPPIDAGLVAFTIVFGIFWAVVAATCGSELLHTRGASKGLLFIAAVLGGLLVLTGAFILAVSAGEADPRGRIESSWMIGLGTLFLATSVLVLWRRRTTS